MGKGVLPDDHPQSLFSLGIHKKDYVHCALDLADLVITVGYDIVEYPPSVWNERRDKSILHLDFRIAEPDEFYHPDLEIVGDVSHALWAIRNEMGETRFFKDEMKKLRAFIDDKLHRETWEPHFPPKPQLLVREVRSVMGRDDIICLDNGIYKLWFARMYETYEENSVLLDNALATMGAGLASAMAAKLVHPERRVLAICGDGGFMMNSQDLETAVRLKLDVVVLLIRDDAYGFIRWKQADMGFPDFGMDFENPDFVDYAKAYGATGLRVERGTPISETLEDAFSRSGPVLVDCPIDYSENEKLSDDLAAQVRQLVEPR
jgi:acetolactate synthase-1/2/3 large subunit